jgi:hypothetical protein
MMRNPKHLRERGRDCLNIAKGVRGADRDILEDIAFEIDATAASIEAERRRRPLAWWQLSTHSCR